MTGAHLGPRRSWCVVRVEIAAPRGVGSRRGHAAMVMSATMWIFNARFFGTFWQRT